MSSTGLDGNVSRNTVIRAFAANLTRQLLQPRETRLGRRAPKSLAVHQLRRTIACGRAEPWRMLLTVSAADLEDGIPLALVVAPYESAIAMLTQRDRERRRATRRPLFGGVARMLCTAFSRERSAEAALDQAELRSLAAPNDARALAAVETCASACEAEAERMLSVVRSARVDLVAGEAEGCLA